MTTLNTELRKRENRGNYYTKEKEEKPQKELNDFFEEEPEEE